MRYCHLMNGPGPIQRRILRAFAANPGATLSTGDLILWCYPRRLGQKHDHRLCIRRAAESVCDRVGVGWKGSIIWREKPPQR